MFATDSCWWYPRVCCLHPIFRNQTFHGFLQKTSFPAAFCSRKSKALWLAIFANQLLEMMDRCSAQSRPLLMQILGYINLWLIHLFYPYLIGDLLWGTPKSFESSKLLVVFIEETNSWKLHTYIYIYTHRASNHLLLLPESKVNNLLILNSSVTKSRRCANV